jgi:leader peptidase (prepilin peptidase)/N-methyltransferase
MFTFVSLLIVATFIDFEHFIIPDSVTIGGTIAGLVFSAGLPWLHGETAFGVQESIRSLMWSVIGAAIGFALLWLVSWLGRLAFGRKKLLFEKAVPFTWKLEGEGEEKRARFTIAGDEQWWDELFATEKDTLVMQCESFSLGEKTAGTCEIRSLYERLTFDGEEHDLNHVETFTGTLTQVEFRRTAMGFGDVKFIACIGAFLGWQATIFSVTAGAFLGAFLGYGSRLIGKKEWSTRIPYGPCLAFGALVWFFYGPQFLDWYLNWSNPIAGG